MIRHLAPSWTSGWAPMAIAGLLLWQNSSRRLHPDMPDSHADLRMGKQVVLLVQYLVVTWDPMRLGQG